MCSSAVEVSTDQSSYVVTEDVGQLEVWISVTSGQIAPGEELQIAVEVMDVNAIGELKNSVSSRIFISCDVCVIL